MQARILVVGQATAFRESLVRLLSLEGYDAVGAASVEEAFARLETESVSAVLADTDLPDDSIPFARMVRIRWPDAGFVLLTGADDETGAEVFHELADDWLPRARCRTDLATVVRRSVRTATLRRENLDLRRALEGRTAGPGVVAVGRPVLARRSRRRVLRTLMIALAARDAETRRHSERVAEYTLRIAAERGIGARERRELYYGALLHDVGKIGIPDGILLKAGPLTEAEWAVMHAHPRIGHNILSTMPFLAGAAECALCHHERWDGGGYPLGLSEGEIPANVRIVAVADALDAMSVQRPYRDALPFDRIREELWSNRGSQFEPRVVEIALRLFRSWEDLHGDARRRHGHDAAPGNGSRRARGRVREAA